jgi:hypothetical protein
MIPSIFISSTIQDLNHLRDSIRDLIIEIGYTPVMSEYGEVGFLPDASAEDSCYIALKDCQLAVFIIGKRYGSISKNGLSVTHNEFRTTREKKISTIFLINDEVQSFKRVYEINDNKDTLTFPGMDNPGKLFQLIQEFSDSDLNNGFVLYNNVQSAKQNLKKQIAHIVGDLLTKHFDPVKGEIKDILSEITTLRHILLKNEQEVARQFSVAFRFLLNEENNYLKDIAETISGSLEEGVPELLKSANLKSYLKSKGVEIRNLTSSDAANELSIHNSGDAFKKGISKIYYSILPHSTKRTRASLGGTPEYDIKPDDPNDNSVVFAIGKTNFLANKNAEKLLETMFNRLKETAI